MIFSLSRFPDSRLKFRPYLYVKFLDTISTVGWSPLRKMRGHRRVSTPTVFPGFHFKNNAEFSIFFGYEIQAFFFEIQE